VTPEQTHTIVDAQRAAQEDRVHLTGQAERRLRSRSGYPTYCCLSKAQAAKLTHDQKVGLL
jgi:hypothetical protein